MNKITLKSPAKINLALKIKEKRKDGYHEIETIMQTIDLSDKITIKKKNKGITVKTNIEALNNKENIAYKALLEMKKYIGNDGVEIYIEKNIPIGSGLGGGSSNAATVIKGINKLFNLSLDNDTLYEIAEKLGSDVPFFILGGTSFVTGRGDIIKKLPDLDEFYVVIVNPNFKISAAWAYTEYDKLNKKSNNSLKHLINLIKNKKDITWQEGWENDFEEVIFKNYPELLIIKEKLKELGALFVLLSGSGPSIYGIFKNKKQAQKVKMNWPRKDLVIVTKTKTLI